MTDAKSSLSLEQRVSLIEDRLDILNLISKYGPAVDSGSLQVAAELWTEDGLYDISGIGRFEGRTGIIGMLEGELHQSLIAGGSAHVLSLPYITLDGDTAVATDYGQVYVPKPDGFGIFRSIASRWEFERTAEGWQCVRRVNELLDGRSAARELLSRAL